MCVGNRPLLRVGPFIIVRRYIYKQALKVRHLSFHVLDADRVQHVT